MFYYHFLVAYIDSYELMTVAGNSAGWFGPAGSSSEFLLNPVILPPLYLATPSSLPVPTCSELYCPMPTGDSSTLYTIIKPSNSILPQHHLSTYDPFRGLHFLYLYIYSLNFPNGCFHLPPPPLLASECWLCRIGTFYCILYRLSPVIPWGSEAILHAVILMTNDADQPLRYFYNDMPSVGNIEITVPDVIPHS